MPCVHVLDYDREGQTGAELADFADEMTAARADLAAYQDPADKLELLSLAESIEQFREYALTGDR